jgi:predicted nucleotidyltransferase
MCRSDVVSASSLCYSGNMPDAIEKRNTKAPAGAKSREAVVARLRSHADEIREGGIVSLSIFGSRARGEERPDSDLDVLIAYDPQRPFTLYDLVRAERLLEDLTGLDVHVTTRDGFRPHQLDRVLKEAVSVL